MNNNILSDIFNMVSSTRQKGWLLTKFKPLNEYKAQELKGLVKDALNSPLEPQYASLQSTLKEANDLFDRYDSMPETTNQLAETVPSGFSYSAQRGDTILPMGNMSFVYRNLPNPKRPKTLKKIQRALYNSLKSFAVPAI